MSSLAVEWTRRDDAYETIEQSGSPDAGTRRLELSGDGIGFQIGAYGPLYPIQDYLTRVGVSEPTAEVAPPRSGDVPHYHWHFEIIPTLTTVAGFEWGSGFFVTYTAPEEAAAILRDS